MVKFRPFKGVLYNKEKVGDYANVVSQPYDKISPKMQDGYYKTSDYNVAHLIKNKSEVENDSYKTAKHYVNKWIEEGVLQKQDEDLYFFLEQTYSIFGETHTRKAIIGLGKVQDYADKVIMPHEQTLKGPKVDRLELLRTTKFNFGQIFMLYRDPENVINTELNKIQKSEQYFSITDDEDVIHNLYLIKDDATQKVITEFLDDKRLYIADGHHRYETALAHAKENYEKNDPENLSQYRMMTLVNAYDEGLKVLPTHRLVNTKLKYDYSEVMDEISQYFDVKYIPVPKKREQIHDLIAALPEHSLLFYAKDEKESLLQLTLENFEYEKKISESLSKLDVYMLHELILFKILGITKEDLAQKTYITYKRGAEGAIKEVEEETHSMCFLLKATDVENVLEVADDKETMPQKSTDFYPKILSGYVLADIKED